MNEVLDQLRLTIGPLNYEFRAHDAWGVDALNRLRTHLLVQDFDGDADRVFHLADLKMTRDDNDQIHRDGPAERYSALLPAGAPRQDWRLTADETGHITSRHDHTPHSLFLFGRFASRYLGPFQLPWPVMLEDIVARRGGILHGGLIAQNGRGWILTAPPGGGKTTAIGRLPAEWQVLADDACLVWPDAENGFQASPLPTWSVLLGRGEALPAIRRWQTGTTVPLGGIVLLHKSEQDQVRLVAARQALLPLHRALSEHPQVLARRAAFATPMFDMARLLSQTAPVWELDATLDGRFWQHLPKMMEREPVSKRPHQTSKPPKRLPP